MNTLLWSARIYFQSDDASTPEWVKAEKNGEKIEFFIANKITYNLKDVLVSNYEELEIVSFSDAINTDRSFLLTLLSKYDDDGKPSSVDYFAAVKENGKTVPKQIVLKTARIWFPTPGKDECEATVPDRYKDIFEKKISSILISTDHKTEFLLSFVRHLKNDSREHTNANYTIWSKLLSEPDNGAEILFEKPGRFIVLNVALTNEFLIVKDVTHKYITKILFRNNTTQKHSKLDWTINPYGANPGVYSRYLPPIDYFQVVYVKMISKDDDKSEALFPYDIATAKVEPIAKQFENFDMDSVHRILKNIVHYEYLAEPWTIMCVWMPRFKKIELVEIDNGLRKKTCIVSQETSLLLSKDENIRGTLSPGLVNFAMFIRNICARVHEAKRAVMHEIQKYADINIKYWYRSIETSTAFSAYTMNQDINELNIQSMGPRAGFMVDDVDLRTQLSQNHSGSPPVITLKEKKRVLILDLSHMQDQDTFLLLSNLEPHTIDVLVSDEYYGLNRNVYSLMIPYSAYYTTSNKRHEHLKIEEIIVSVVEEETQVLRFSSATIQVNSGDLKRFLAIVAKLHKENPNFVQNGNFDDVMKQLTNNELFSEHDEMPLVAAEKTSYTMSRKSGTLPHGRTVLDTDSHASSASSLSSTAFDPHASTADSTFTDDSTVSDSDSTVSDSDASESVSTESESVSTVSASDELTASDYVSDSPVSTPRTTEASSQNLGTTPRFVREIREATVKDAIHRLLHGRSRSKSRKW